MTLLLITAFLLTDVLLYIYLARKYKSWNIFKVAKVWMKEGL